MIFQTSLFPIDGLSLCMLMLVMVLFPLIFIFSLSYVKRNLFRYYLVLSLTFLSMLGVVLARDFLSFYVFLEIMMVGIYFLIIDNTKKESFPAGFKYILMMFVGGVFILVSTLMLYNLTGTFEMGALARISSLLPRSTISFIFTLFAIGCLLEIGAVPFHIWIPDAHPIAPSPISALLSGLVIKVGAYGVIRMIFALQTLSSGLILVGAVSMLFGVVLALKQTNVKRILAYHTISQMGYVLLGTGIGTGLGMGGALFHILNHATFKMLLFLSMGAVIYATKERDLEKLGGLGKHMPVTVTTFGIAALAISGIPPLNGFASKALISAAASGSLFLRLILLLTAAGTFASFFKLFLHVFAGDLPPKLKNIKEVPILMLFPMLVLAGICVVVGVFPNLILNGLISPSLESVIPFDFWDIRILAELLIIIFLGSSIYILGSKSRMLGIGEPLRKRKNHLSLDKICCNSAAAIEMICQSLKKLLARSLNVYLFWVFLTLVILLLVLRFIIV